MAASTTRTVKAKFDGDAKGMVAAAAAGEKAIDHFGDNVEKKFRKSGERASKGFGQSIKKWFGGAGGLSELGNSGGTVFGSGFLGALKTPILGPALVAALGAAVAVAAPAAGAVLASGLVAGFGAGLAGLGIVFAAKSERVKKTWHDTLAGMGADMSTFSKPYEATLVSIAGFTQRTFAKFAPALERALKESAPFVTQFAEEVFKGLEKLEPAVMPLTKAFQAVLRTLGPAVQSAIGRTSTALIKLADSVKRNPEGLADLVKGFGDVVGTALDFVTLLNDVNGKFRDLTGGVSLVTVVMRGLQAVMAPLIGLFGGLNKGLDLINALTHSTEASGASMSAAASSVVVNAQALQKQAGAASGSATATTAAGAAAESAATKYARQAAATDALITSLFRLQGLSLGLSQSQIAFQAAIDAATESIKTNGRTLDIHTEKGRANRSALNDVAQSANAQTEAMLKSNQGTAAAARTAEASKANFIRLAVQMGVNQREAKRMADEMIAIPNVTRTAKLQANKKDLEAKIAAAKRELDDPKGVTKTRRAKLEADIANARAGIATINGMLAGLPSSKTVTIKTVRQTIETVIRPDVGVRAPGRASGGLMQPGRTYLLGERGPEPVVMGQNGGARAISNESAPRELASASQPIIVENHIEIGGEVVRVVRTEIRADKRDTKRRVNAR